MSEQTPPGPHARRLEPPTAPEAEPSTLRDSALAALGSSPPPQIGPYRILGQIGAGGFGVVYRASTTTGIRQVVALKVLRAHVGSENAARRFRREAEILRRLHHPGIAGYFDAGVHDGRPYFVMEYIDGMGIVQYCDQNKLSVGERLALFVQVCEAVQHAHSKLVIHRDLKPSNILVTGEGAPKLVDFGIATFSLEDLAADGDVQTIGDERALTPEYAGPEQLRGTGLREVTIDVYSLGVILYELLSGHRPFRFPQDRNFQKFAAMVEEGVVVPPSTRVRSREEVAGLADPETGEATTRTITPESVATQRSTRLDRLRRQLAGDLDLIALKALRPEPMRRYQSVAALLDDLNRFQNGHPVRARPDSTTYRVRKFVRRNRTAVALTSALLGAVVVATSAGWRSAASERNAAVEREQLAETARAASEQLALLERARGDDLSKLVDVLLDNAREQGGTLRSRAELSMALVEFLDWMSSRAGVTPGAVPGAIPGAIPGLGRNIARAGAGLLDVIAAINDSSTSSNTEVVRSALARGELILAAWRSVLASGEVSREEAQIGLAVVGRDLASLERVIAQDDLDRAAQDKALKRSRQTIVQAIADARGAIAEAPASARAKAALLEALVTHVDIALRLAGEGGDRLGYSTAIDLLRADLDVTEAPIAALATDPAATALVEAIVRGQTRVGLWHDREGRAAQRVDPERSAAERRLALSRYARALELQRLVVMQPDASLRSRIALKDCLQWVSRINRGLGEFEAAQAHLEEFLTQAESLRSPDPDLEDMFSDVSRYHEQRALLAIETGDLPGAIESYGHALEALADASRVGFDRQPAFAQRRALMLGVRADQWAALGTPEGQRQALASRKEAISLYQELRERHPRRFTADDAKRLAELETAVR